jgi:release factor glutamine methyltransferase
MTATDDKDANLLLKEKYAGVPSPQYEADLERLKNGEPLAYVIGWVDFLGARLDLYARPLIPRPETEYWTEKAMTVIERLYAKKDMHILDICAGSGCIGIALLKHIPRAHVDFAEKDPELVTLIEKNIRLNDIDATRTHVFASDVFSAVTKRYGAIVANPPYIDKDKGDVALSVLEHEPHEALFAADHGLAIITELLEKSKAHLVDGGMLFIEFARDTEKVVARIAVEKGWSVAILPDQYGVPRWLIAE